MHVAIIGGGASTSVCEYEARFRNNSLERVCFAFRTCNAHADWEVQAAPGSPLSVVRTRRVDAGRDVHVIHFLLSLLLDKAILRVDLVSHVTGMDSYGCIVPAN